MHAYMKHGWRALGRLGCTGYNTSLSKAAQRGTARPLIRPAKPPPLPPRLLRCCSHSTAAGCAGRRGRAGWAQGAGPEPQPAVLTQQRHGGALLCVHSAHNNQLNQGARLAVASLLTAPLRPAAAPLQCSEWLAAARRQRQHPAGAAAGAGAGGPSCLHVACTTACTIAAVDRADPLQSLAEHPSRAPASPAARNSKYGLHSAPAPAAGCRLSAARLCNQP